MLTEKVHYQHPFRQEILNLLPFILNPRVEHTGLPHCLALSSDRGTRRGIRDCRHLLIRSVSPQSWPSSDKLRTLGRSTAGVYIKNSSHSVHYTGAKRSPKGLEPSGVLNFGENNEVLTNGGTEGIWLGFGV